MTNTIVAYVGRGCLGQGISISSIDLFVQIVLLSAL